MKKLKNNKNLKYAISFRIFKGDKQYIAEGVDVPVVTQAKSLDKLSTNIVEAVSLYLESSTANRKIKSKNPSIFMNIELPLVHATA